MSNILVTGGAGFIGSFIVDELIRKGHSVRVYDNLEPRIHNGKIPAYMNKDAEFVKGDVRDYEVFSKALEDIDVVFHEAALVGIEPSIKEPKKFVDVNTGGTVNLFDIIIKKELDIKKIIVPSTVGIYGEGTSYCEKCNITSSNFRSSEQFKNNDWEVRCVRCNSVMKSLPVNEDKSIVIKNIYSMTKLDQEVMSLAIGKSIGVPVTALRYFNVYGPRQSVVNPYSGVITKFVDNLLARKKIKAFEDGNQTRDFINVKDIVQANILSMEKKEADYESFNVGTGKGVSIKEIGEQLIDILNLDKSLLEVSNEFREGDIRHCTADITKIKEKLGFEVSVDFKEGLKEIIDWQRKS